MLDPPVPTSPTTISLPNAAEPEEISGGSLYEPTTTGRLVGAALMAPAVPKKRSSMTPPPPAPTPEAAPAPSVPAMGAGGRMPAQMVAMLQRLRAEVEKNCDYVGPDLAEEARRIHRGESEERGIYGEASAEEAESLAEEGIELQSIPWVSRADG